MIPSLRNLETAANDGSPSGFGLNQLEATDWHPTQDADFTLKAVRADREEILILGSVPANLRDTIVMRGEILSHPGNPRLAHAAQEALNSQVNVWATSSGRTVASLDYPKYHIKLDFDGQLGRTIRRLEPMHGLHSLAIWETISASAPPQGLFFYPEICSVFRMSSKDSWGYLVREFHEFPNIESRPVRVPMFALCSNSPLGDQMRSILAETSQPRDMVRLIWRWIIQLYFWLLEDCGLHIELNAQNIIVLFDESNNLLGIAVRDFQDIEFDLSFCSLDRKIASFFPYNVIGRQLDRNAWQIRHSIAFDHKLVNYVLIPLMKRVLGSEDNAILSEARIDLKDRLHAMPHDFFAPGLGFRFHSGDLVRTRPVVQDIETLLR